MKRNKNRISRTIDRNVLTLPMVTRELRDLRCCDGDAVTLECKVHAAPEAPLVRWERGGKVDFRMKTLSFSSEILINSLNFDVY